MTRARVGSGARQVAAEARAVPCPTCGTAAGSDCVTSTGRAALFAHTPRVIAVRRASREQVATMAGGERR